MALVLLYQYYKFNWWHCSPQGRYFFPMLAPFGILAAAGWLALFPRPLKRGAALLLMLFLLALNIYVYATYPQHPSTLEELPPQYTRHISPNSRHNHAIIVSSFNKSGYETTGFQAILG